MQLSLTLEFVYKTSGTFAIKIENYIEMKHLQFRDFITHDEKFV